MQNSRTTAQKLEFRRFLEANREREMTVEEMADELRQAGSGIGIATVYRAVKRLENEGVLLRIVSGGKSKAVYKYLGDNSARSMHMLFCQCCGRTVPIPYSLASKFESTIASNTGFSITDHQLLLYGRCPDCK